MTTKVPAVLIVGDDPYLISEAVAKALAGVDPLSVDELPVGPGAEERAAALQALEMPSLFGGRRAVVVRGVDDAPAEGQRAFVAYLKNPNPDCLLVMTAVRPLPALAEAVRAVGHVVEAGKGKRNDLFLWLRDELRRRGLRPSGDAMGALIEGVGEERMALAHALDELSLALGRDGLVGPDEVARQFEGQARTNTFAFLDAVATGQTGTALVAMRVLLAQGEPALVLLGALTRHVRGLIEVGDGPAAQVARELGLHSFRAEKLVKQAAGFSKPALAQAYRAMATADHRLKSGQESDTVALEKAVVAVAGLCSARGRAGAPVPVGAGTRPGARRR